MTDKETEVPTDLAPDPDEDELDDLDDVLDEFSATKLEDSKVPAVVNQSANQDAKSTGGEEDEFAKQLQAGMAELLGSLGQNPEMQAELESMMKELGDTAAKEGSATGPASAPKSSGDGTHNAKPKKNGEETFQDTIRKTMERMQNSGETASAAAASSSEEDMLAQMLKEMEKGNFPGLDGGSEEDFNKMLMGMMEQLTNKEILYEPMKDLHEKYPIWLKDNADKTKAEDLARYKEQQSLVGEIVARFDRAEYSDDNQADRDYIVERMQKMQAAGSPPADLVGDMGSAQEMFGEMEGGLHPAAKLFLVLPELDTLAEQSEEWVQRMKQHSKADMLIVRRCPGMKHGWTQFPDFVLAKHERAEKAKVYVEAMKFLEKY
ncbi:Peroxisome bioproteinsis protein 19-1 [Sphaceloma murrayae]|uniref:Peroxisome bioproteinsis protein 19-1 n=1 Tax=Sphaceloma murrayae TaxID=2082308 RepID=A0A2K1QFY9_9PEZI|nr:Peroxisome bioproteinsis protein 19-1 [Sphaceloma murrayae]